MTIPLFVVVVVVVVDLYFHAKLISLEVIILIN